MSALSRMSVESPHDAFFVADPFYGDTLYFRSTASLSLACAGCCCVSKQWLLSELSLLFKFQPYSKRPFLLSPDRSSEPRRKGAPSND
jgi:hypothetical protein